MLLTVPYESDPGDKTEWAGARVLRMILRSVGVQDPPQGTLLDVHAMYDYARARNDPGEAPSGFWAIDPRGMWQTVMDMDPRVAAGATSWVIYDSLPTQAAADNQVMDTISNYQTAPATLTTGGHHWVCVTGFALNSSNALLAFYVNDPEWTSGGPQTISLSAWDMFFDTVSGGAKWLGKHVEVGDPHPAVRMVPRAPRGIRRPGDVIIPPKDVVGLAIEGVRAIANDSPDLIKAVEGGKAGTPLLVATAHREDTYYYLVPFGGEPHETTTAAVIVDARFGDVWSAKALGEGFKLVHLQRDEVRRHLAAHPLPIHEPIERIASRILDEAHGCTQRSEAPDALPHRGLRFMIERELAGARHPVSYLSVREHAIEVLEQLVWRPCYGSSSPFFPYYVARAADHTIYVNAHTGHVALDWDMCWWYPLGA